MAHDFRTPMTKILSYAEMLKDPKFKFNSEMIEKAIYVIYNNINIMKRSLDQILVLSKLEHVEQLQELYYYNLKHFVTNILLLFEKEINDKHLKVYVNIDENIEIKADEDVLYHLFKNIISNAIKYNKDGGEISITATRNLDEIILEIYDSGIGIKDDEVEKIFNRFFRGSNAKSLQGTGLGMSIVYQSILKLNWDIKVESKEGVYTKVLIFIPIA